MDGFIFAAAGGSAMGMILWIAGIFALMYFLFIRPQKKQMEERNSMLERLESDTKILTAGGFTGVIRAVTEEYVYVELAEGLIVEMSKQGVAQILDDEDDDEDDLEELEEVDEELEMTDDDVDDAGQQV